MLNQRAELKAAAEQAKPRGYEATMQVTRLVMTLALRRQRARQTQCMGKLEMKLATRKVPRKAM